MTQPPHTGGQRGIVPDFAQLELPAAHRYTTYAGSCTRPLRIIIWLPKPGKMPPTQPVLEGARPWSHTFCITNLLCWHSHGSS